MVALTFVAEAAGGCRASTIRKVWGRVRLCLHTFVDMININILLQMLASWPVNSYFNLMIKIHTTLRVSISVTLSTIFLFINIDVFFKSI